MNPKGKSMDPPLPALTCLSSCSSGFPDTPVSPYSLRLYRSGLGVCTAAAVPKRVMSPLTDGGQGDSIPSPDRGSRTANNQPATLNQKDRCPPK
ncbi:hypothetical protein BaRGS_00000583 [Batillaria attramentaria]|uniref:Uncharacterized protein n=1 Tax=Batillaria attramentaria TaxID=370345 RepID=A0ABD0MA33_9CAEN